MDKYYYLVSQVPELKFGGEVFLSKDDFIEQALKWLSEGDFALLEKVNINNASWDDSGCVVIKEYKQFESNLREEIAKYRGAVKRKEEYQLREPLKSILIEGNPLEVEKKLLHLRWGFIEELQNFHYFDIGFLILYMLKIQILAHLVVFDKEKGRAVFNELSQPALM